jgi:CDP-diglyceride synthetase
MTGILVGLSLVMGIFMGGSYKPIARFILESIILILAWLTWRKYNDENQFSLVTPLTLLMAIILLIAGVGLTHAVNTEFALENITMYWSTLIFILMITNLKQSANEIVFMVIYLAVVIISIICLTQNCCAYQVPSIMPIQWP